MTASWFADKIEQWPTAKLLPYARNARTHSDDQVAQIAASIVEFGWTNPILVDAEGVVVAGHGRLLAARRLGIETVPVVVLGHLTPAQRRAYVIADNKLALNAGWNEELLAAELHALNGEGFDLALTGFSDAELEAFRTLASKQATINSTQREISQGEKLSKEISDEQGRIRENMARLGFRLADFRRAAA